MVVHCHVCTIQIHNTTESVTLLEFRQSDSTGNKEEGRSLVDNGSPWECRSGGNHLYMVVIHLVSLLGMFAIEVSHLIGTCICSLFKTRHNIHSKLITLTKHAAMPHLKKINKLAVLYIINNKTIALSYTLSFLKDKLETFLF